MQEGDVHACYEPSDPKERLFGGDCARISRLRAVLESMQLSAGRWDSGISGSATSIEHMTQFFSSYGLLCVIVASWGRERSLDMVVARNMHYGSYTLPPQLKWNLTGSA